MEEMEFIKSLNNTIWGGALVWVLSLIISNGITCFVSNKKVKYEYNLDYNKLILSKRLIAYEEIEALIYEFDQDIPYIFSNFKDPRNIKMMFLEENLEVPHERCLEVLKHNLWMSKEIKTELSRLHWLIVGLNDYIIIKNRFILDRYIDKYIKVDMLEQYKEFEGANLNILKKENVILGSIFYKEIDEIIQKIRTLIYEDLKTLNKIDEFLKSGHSQ